jgi:hypothetical protein
MSAYTVDFGCINPRYKGYNPSFYNRVIAKRAARVISEKYDLTKRDDKHKAVIEMKQAGVVSAVIAEIVGYKDINTVSRIWRKELSRVQAR